MEKPYRILIIDDEIKKVGDGYQSREYDIGGTKYNSHRLEYYNDIFKGHILKTQVEVTYFPYNLPKKEDYDEIILSAIKNKEYFELILIDKNLSLMNLSSKYEPEHNLQIFFRAVTDNYKNNNLRVPKILFISGRNPKDKEYKTIEKALKIITKKNSESVFRRNAETFSQLYEKAESSNGEAISIRGSAFTDFTEIIIDFCREYRQSINEKNEKEKKEMKKTKNSNIQVNISGRTGTTAINIGNQVKGGYSQKIESSFTTTSYNECYNTIENFFNDRVVTTPISEQKVNDFQDNASKLLKEVRLSQMEEGDKKIVNEATNELATNLDSPKPKLSFVKSFWDKIKGVFSKATPVMGKILTIVKNLITDLG